MNGWRAALWLGVWGWCGAVSPWLACGRSDGATPASSASGGDGNAPEPPPDHPLRVGERAPRARGLAHLGQRIGARDLSGVPVAVYFCPTHADPACRGLALGLKRRWLALTEVRAMVLGATQDDRVNARESALADALPFLLVSDPAGEFAKAWGHALEERRYPAQLVVYVVGADGVILQRLEAPQAEQVAAALRQAGGRQGAGREAPLASAGGAAPPAPGASGSQADESDHTVGEPQVDDLR